MCGICGLVSGEPAGPLEERVRRMVRTIAHRGPDAEGVFAADGVALGHRRLSIIDLTSNGAQPMHLGNTSLVYNGEAFNFQELRRDLEAEGHSFQSQSDTEVVLHLYDRSGIDGLARLEGMFALGLWDGGRRRLVVMRDRLGIKPLYYSWTNGRLAFGSEIKAVLEAGDVGRSLDDQALAEYLWYGNAFEERTIFRDIRVLPPGHRLLLENGQLRVEAWWRIEEWLSHDPGVVEAGEAAIAVGQAVDTAVARQLVSDVPVGLFLSGGIDSSAIAVSAARTGGGPLSSYSVGFDYDRGINELPKARRVADALGLDHHELLVQSTGLEEVLADLVRAHDEPFADAANIPLFLLARALGGSVKVVLQGDGGDEMFAGYRRYAILRHAAMWRMWPEAFGPVVSTLLGGMGSRLARLGAAAGQQDPALRMALLLTVETRRDSPTAMLVDAARRRLEVATDPFLAYRRCAQRFADHDPVQQMLLTDITLQLPCQFLPKVDRATMAHGLEARVPLLDEGVASLAVGIPSSLKVRGTEKKIVLRDALRDRLPAEILDGPKTGFGVPYEHWLRHSLHGFARSAILDPRFVDRFELDSSRLRHALDEHRAGQHDRGFLLWKLLQLSLWSREYLH
jgi:asparagine synthase (glutamine-hydrolysing)